MRQPDKNRYLKALKHIETEEIPFFEPTPDPAVVSRLLGRDVPMGYAIEMPAEIVADYGGVLCTDLVAFGELWLLGRKNIVDAQGRIHYVDGMLKTPGDMRGITLPDLSSIRRRIEGLLEALDGTGIGVMYVPNIATKIVAVAMGYQDYALNLLTCPRFIHDFQERVNDHCLAEMEAVLEYPVDVVQLVANICIKSGPMYSPELREEFIYPFLRQSLKVVKGKGLPACIHSDGDNTQTISDFIEMGFDVIHPIEPTGGQDIYRIKEQYGHRIALHGNIDVAGVLLQGSPDDVRRDVIEHLRNLSPGGGYVCASSHNLTEDIPIENVYALRDAVCGYRHGPLSQNAL